MRTDVNFNWLYVRKLKIEVMYEKPRVNVKVERGSNLRLENYNDFN